MEFDNNYKERFWSKIDIKGKEDCWEWFNYKSPDGYGRTRYPNHGNFTLASRIAYILTYGEIDKNIRVLHICDNPSCCNPNHLFLGTQTDNIYDMENKGRSKHIFPKRRIAREDVLEIRYKYSSGLYTQQDLSKFYNVCLQAIRNIVTGKTHKKVGGPISKNNIGLNQYNYNIKDNKDGKFTSFDNSTSI